MKAFLKNNWWRLLLTVLCLGVNVFIGCLGVLWFSYGLGANDILATGALLIFPVVVLPFIWLRKKKLKICLIGVISFLLIYAIVLFTPIAIDWYEDSITVEDFVNIDVNEYMPFRKGSKIAVLDEESTLKLTSDLPVVDGAAAFFPVYSAYVNAVYPSNTELTPIGSRGVFCYNNTSFGYNYLARKNSDIFFGVYPSEEQIEFAKEQGTNFIFTPIGEEAFVFFTHKNNPVDSLTIEQVKDIYSGKITNWKEVGGKNVPIKAYQRNKDSGSQSMMERFMGDTPLMTPPTHQVEGLMSGLLDVVTDYQNRNSAIGYSYRYYLTGIIENPDVKVLKINGVEPTNENVRNGSYPITTPIYAVTYEGQDNENVQILLEWVLGSQGQELLEKTGYVGLMESK